MRAYLAGPEVFLPNARAALDAKIELTRRHGFTPVSPGDLDIPPTDTKRAKGLAISAKNERLMLSADLIIANLTPFRGIAADAGTVYELGFMCARGCPAYAFSNTNRSHLDRVLGYYEGAAKLDPHGVRRGPDELAIEKRARDRSSPGKSPPTGSISTSKPSRRAWRSPHAICSADSITT